MSVVLHSVSKKVLHTTSSEAIMHLIETYTKWSGAAQRLYSIKNCPVLAQKVHGSLNLLHKCQHIICSNQRRTVQAVGTVGLRLGPSAPAAVLDERPLADPARGVERPLPEDDLALLPVKVLALLDLDFRVLCVLMKPVKMTIS